MAFEKAKGKKRERAQDELSAASSSSLSSAPPDPTPAKRQRRAETRECPICNEPIPLRLLGRHAVLESERVEEIIRNVGSTDVIYQDDLEEGPSTSRPGFGSRRSALKARKSLSQNASNASSTTVQTNKIIQIIKRNRKQRHAKLREMTREDEDGFSHVAGGTRSGRGEIVCPVCLANVAGDEDVLDAHVDACLAGETRRLEEENERELARIRQEEEEELWEEPIGDVVGHVGNVRGTGFHTRNHNDKDVDEEIDVDGDDEVFGDAQFTEGDILGPSTSISRPVTSGEDVQVEVEEDSEDEAQREQKTLRDLVAAGKVVRGKSTPIGDEVDVVKTQMDEVMGVGELDKMDQAILAARTKGDQRQLIAALEIKTKRLESMRVSSTAALLCRICLDPYDEATVSTGCWHTCCRECWLRCLGSTKLCPICKRITAATDLRRIYL